MKRKNLFIYIILLIVVCVAGYFTWNYFDSKKIQVPYSDFYKQMSLGKVETVTIKENQLEYELKDPSTPSTSSGTTKSSTVYRTTNPHSSTLEESLLKKGVKVTVEKDSAEIFSLIFDIIFYVFFFGTIIVVFRKFISPNTFKVVHKTGVKFDDVVGMDNLKRDMTQVMKIMQNAKEYAAKGIRMPKGILLEGEPGNGKTLFAKALAGEAKVNFIPAKATDFESMFMAIGPMKVKLLFRKARKQAPCIVFIDEFDGIGTVRNYTGSALETENTRIVTALLNELDGFEPSKGVLVLAATNSIEALDPALIRPGRFDARFKVPYPDYNARVELVKMYCNGKNPDAACTPETLAKYTDGYSCAKIESVLNRAALLAGQNNRVEFTMDDFKRACSEL
ncbi:MAG: ATP-dependent metallopeptidase FtsH/Yme1/Tma family protein [Treponema sp.]|nr:ATP-dependent metallopeptidase FtsH/Yme1/Tma family protein [Treponema sp.]